MLPDLESLRCFEAVARRRSFRAASEELALSPAAVSGRVQRLEQLLGATLLARTTRRVDLTPAGLAVMAQAVRCLDAARACRDAVAGEVDTVSLRIGTRHELGVGWLVPHLDALEAMQPGRRLDLVVSDGRALLEGVRRGSVDAAVLSTRLAGLPFDYSTLHEERVVPVVAPSLLARHPLETPEDVVGMVLLDTAPDLPLFRYLADAVGGLEAWPFGRRELLGTIAGVRARARAGVGLAVLPEAFVADDLDRGALVRVFPAIEPRTDAFRLLWMRSDPRAPVFATLAEHLRALPLSYAE